MSPPRGKQGKKARKPARPRLRLVKSPRPKARPARAPAGAADRELGPTKQRLLFELMRSRAAVLAAIRGLDAKAAERPMAPGKWNVRQTVLHLCVRDRVRLRELESTRRGVPHSWADFDRAQEDRANAEDLAPLTHVGWEEALELLNATRNSLRVTLEGIPEDPVGMWTADHPFGRMLLGLPPHDIHHAEAIRRWREEQGL